MLLKLNSHHVLVKFTEHTNSTFFGGEGEEFDISNFALSFPPLLVKQYGTRFIKVMLIPFAAMNYIKKGKVRLTLSTLEANPQLKQVMRLKRTYCYPETMSLSYIEQ